MIKFEHNVAKLFSSYVGTFLHMSVATSSTNMCKLMDWCGSRETVAEGRWSSSDPKQLIHHTSLGSNVVCVWVDIARNPNACLWRPSCEMSSIEEAIESRVAWPADKVVQS